MIKYYNDGKSFLENEKIDKYNDLISSINEFDINHYIFKIEEENSKIYAISNNDLLIFGDISLIDILSDTIINTNLSFNLVYGNKELIKEFIKSFEVKMNYKFKLIKEEFDLVYYSYTKSNIKTALFAGGCFWCMATPFYNLDGVIKVYSGYAGGTTLSPSYLETKKGNTGHKETIFIIYDENIISYNKLLKLFFESIDPFDPNGQFIDRGSNYETGIFTNNLDEINKINDIIKEVEDTYNKKVYVKLLKNAPFFMAEEYHQGYSLKNKKAYQEEEALSGRLNFEFIKLKND